MKNSNSKIKTKKPSTRKSRGVRAAITPLSLDDVIAELESEVLAYQERYRKGAAVKTITALKVAIGAVRRCKAEPLNILSQYDI